jgi:HK97 family phage portal protein
MSLLSRLRGPSPGEMVSQVLEREFVEPGTEVSIQPQVDAFWSELRQTGFFSPRSIERVWVAARCIQLNAQQIASMPLRFEGTFQPAWVSSPDPVFYPNGISDAIFSVTRSIYGWGDAFLYITSRYATGFPATWTVLDPAAVRVELVDGRRQYVVNEKEYSDREVVQITRDPGGGLRGTSALRAYASQAWSQIGAGTTAQNIMGGGTVPPVTLMAKRKLTADQARAVQDQWVAARSRYGSGVPAILSSADFEKPEALNINPKDLALLDLAEYDARVLASAFGVPSFLLNLAMTGSLVYQNPEGLREFWWWSELYPMGKRIADALSANMLPAGNSVSFDATLPSSSAAEPGSSMTESATGGASPNVMPLRPAATRESVALDRDVDGKLLPPRHRPAQGGN